MALVLQLKGITKRFGGVAANDKVDLSVEEGQVHCIIGENGAGKSTAMNILYGLLRPDAGEILLRGSKVEFHSPKDAIRRGIGMVHQEFMLVPSLTALENIFLGFEITRCGVFLDLNSAQKKLESMLADGHLSVPLTERIGRLPVALRQRVEIVKLLFRGADILILDEPTAVLAPQESESFFGFIRALKEQGKTIIFITHKLREVMEIADSITVMRDGRVVGHARPREVDEPTLARMMVDRGALLELDKAAARPGEVILTVSDLWVKDDRGNGAVRGASLQVRAGEILGIAGIAGNGQHELAEALFGLRKVDRGTILLGGTEVTLWSSRDLRDLGACYIPQDRMGVGSAVGTAAWKNVIMGHYWRPPIVSGPLISPDAARDFVGSLLRKFNVKLADARSDFGSLSGGNKQKAIVGRELVRRPKFLLAEDPTRGVDIGASSYIRQQIMNEAASGTAVLLISHDLQEAMAMSDRLVVMFEGKLVGEKAQGKMSETEIGLLMTQGRR